VTKEKRLTTARPESVQLPPSDEIKPDDPHWVTGRGPICPPNAKETK